MHLMEEPSDTSDAPSASPTPGQMLRVAREAKGLHLAVLSLALKVPARQLEALENDQYDVFKGVAFVRALAQAVCRHLGLDPAPVLAGLPKVSSPLLQPLPGSLDQAVPASAGQRGTALARGKGVSRPVLLLAALMLLGSVALIWWPDTVLNIPLHTDLAQEASPAPVPAMPASEPPDAAVPAASAALAPASAAVLPASQALVKPQIAASTPFAAASQEKSVTADAPLVMRASADVWVSVRDSLGETVFKRQVKAGESVQLDIVAPLFVYAARGDAMELLWRGKPVDTKAFILNNELRLPIKP